VDIISPQVWLLWWRCGRLTTALKCQLKQEKIERPRESSTVVVDRLALADATPKVERTMGGCRSPTIAGWFGRTISEPLRLRRSRPQTDPFRWSVRFAITR